MKVERELSAVPGILAMLGALLVGCLMLSGCSTGGYVQIGFIPVNQVDDNHRNVIVDGGQYERRK